MAASGGPTPRTPWATAHQRWAVITTKLQTMRLQEPSSPQCTSSRSALLRDRRCKGTPSNREAPDIRLREAPDIRLRERGVPQPANGVGPHLDGEGSHGDSLSADHPVGTASCIWLERGFAPRPIGLGVGTRRSVAALVGAAVDFGPVTDRGCGTYTGR
jgi:hypothetical protein